MVKLEINNVNTKIIGDLTANVVSDLKKSMQYKTLEYNGFTYTEIEHNLFNSIKQVYPTGLFSIAVDVLDKYDVEYEAFDNRITPTKQVPLKLHEVTPHQFQKTIIDEAVKSQRFVIQVATGGGKTVIGAAILAKLNLSSMFVVHTGDLFEQAYDELSSMLKVPIGKIGGGVCDIQRINVCMIQSIHAVLNQKYVPFDEVEKEQMEEDEVVKKSFIKNDKIKKFIESVECVMIDECHHIRAQSYVTVMKAAKRSFYKCGLSATPLSGDGRDMILQAYAGKVIGKISASYLIRHKYLVPVKIYYMLGLPSDKYIFTRKKYNSIYKKYIVNNKYRNSVIVDCVKRIKELKKSVLITVTTKAHGKILEQLIKKQGNISVQFIYSHVDKMTRKEYINQVREKKLDVMIGTSLADEGLNIKSLDALILAGAGKSPTRMIQRIGRVLRISPGKTEAMVIDFKDTVRHLVGHYKKRREICESEDEFKIIESFK